MAKTPTQNTTPMDRPKVVCLGGVHMDVRLRAKHHLVDGASNPVSTLQRQGGVAYNVAQALRVAGLTPRLLTLPPDSARAYIALEDAEGDLVYGLACLDSYENLNGDFIRQHETTIKDADWVLVDGNCQKDAFAAWPDGTSKVALISVSPAKMNHFLPILPKADWLFCNREEWQILQSLYEGSFNRLHILETRGSEGCLLHEPSCDSSGHIHHNFAANEDAATVQATADQTGLGDCLAGLVMQHVICGFDPISSVQEALDHLPETLRAVRSAK